MVGATSNEACDGFAKLSEQDLVDYLCTAVEEEDALYVWIWLRRLKDSGVRIAVTSLHSWKQRSALSFAANAPQTPLRLFILQVLLLSLDAGEGVSAAVKGVGAFPWAKEEARRIEPKREAEAPEAAAFLALQTEHEAADWVDEHLPPLEKDPDELTAYKPLPPRPSTPFTPRSNSLEAPFHARGLPTPTLPPAPSRELSPSPLPYLDLPSAFTSPHPFLGPCASPSSPTPAPKHRSQVLLPPKPSFQPVLPPKPSFQPLLPPILDPPTRVLPDFPPPRHVSFPRDHPIKLIVSPLPCTETVESFTSFLASLDPPITGITDLFFHPLLKASGSTRAHQHYVRAFLTLPCRLAADSLAGHLHGRKRSHEGKPLTVERQVPPFSPRDAWRFPLVTVSRLCSAPSGQRFADLVRATGLGAADMQVFSPSPEWMTIGQAFHAGEGRGTFRVSSPDAAQRAVELLNGLEQVGGGVVKATWGMDEGVGWEVVG